MSSTAAAPARDVFADDENVVEEFEQGGSPADKKLQADGSEGKTTTGDKGEEPESEGVAEGEEPKVEDGAGKAPDAWQEERREMQAQVAAAQELFAEVRAVARHNPAVAKALGLDSGEGAASAGSEWRENVEKSIRDGFVAEKGGDAIMAALTPILDQLEGVLKDVAPVKQTVGRLQQSTAAASFRQGLIDAKVPVDNPAFIKILADLSGDPDFQSSRDRGSKFAIRAAANEWFAKSGKAAINGNARVQLDAAKGGRTGQRTNGASLASKIIKFAEFDPHRHVKLLREADAAGRPRPTIEYDE